LATLVAPFGGGLGGLGATGVTGGGEVDTEETVMGRLLNLQYGPEKWVPVFRKDHAKSWSAIAVHPEIIAL
jgi:hypothetical protein